MHKIIGKTVNVKVDRKIGSRHPKYHDMIYPVNYGYIPGAFAGDGEEQDAYIIGIDYPVEEFTGVVAAVIRRLNDNEDKWVVAPEGMSFSKEEIYAAVNFTEQYFDIQILI